MPHRTRPRSQDPKQPRHPMSEPPPRPKRPPMMDPDVVDPDHPRPSFPFIEPGEMEDVEPERGLGLFMAYSVRR